MATIAEIEKLALDLSESERAVLAAHLLGSLPSVLHDEDEGIAEALRRDAELEGNPSMGISLEELDQRIQRRRKEKRGDAQRYALRVFNFASPGLCVRISGV
jgi:putative addiction module component (TIGR02574 family)